MYFIVKNKIIFSIAFLFLLKPSYFSNIVILDTVFDIGRILSCVTVLGAFVVEIIANKRVGVSKVTLLTFLYLFSLLVSTGLGLDKDYRRYILFYIPAISVVILLDYTLHYAIENLFGILFIWMQILVWTNFVTTVLHPNGILLRYMGFLGMKNAQITYIIFTILLSITLDFIQGKKSSLRTTLLLAISFMTFLINGSTGSMVSMGILCFLMILIMLCNMPIINYRNLLLVIFSFFPLQNMYYTYVIDNFMKKRSFMGRQAIWNATWNSIKQKMILGHGLNHSDYRDKLMANKFANSAHNQILEILYLGGIVLFAIYIIILFIQAKKLMKYKNRCFTQQIAVTMFAFLLDTMVEVQGHHELFFAIMIFPVFYENFVSYKSVYRKKRKVVFVLNRKETIF